MKDLSIQELETYIKLCTINLEKLYREQSLHPKDKIIRDKYFKMYKISNMLTEEANKRLFNLIDDEEDIKENQINA